MFKKNKPKAIAANNSSSNEINNRSEVNTLIGSTSKLEGDLHFTGVLKIDGTIIGNLIAESNDAVLILDEAGAIEGEVNVPSMIINGSITGNVYASEKIDIYPHAKITGDVHYNLLEMEVGAEVNGRMLRQDKQSFDTRNETNVTPIGDSIDTDLEEVS